MLAGGFWCFSSISVGIFMPSLNDCGQLTKMEVFKRQGSCRGRKLKSVSMCAWRNEEKRSWEKPQRVGWNLFSPFCSWLVQFYSPPSLLKTACACVCICIYTVIKCVIIYIYIHNIYTWIIHINRKVVLDLNKHMTKWRNQTSIIRLR